MPRAPAFTALAVGVLGLGLAAVIFMYGVADTLMLKPPPYPNADRLYTIVTIDGAESGRLRRLDAAARLPADPRRARDQFEALGAIYVGTTYLTGDGQAERYDGAFADGHIFDVTGVAPELGRTILPRDTIEGAAPVVVLSPRTVERALRLRPEGDRPHVRVNGKSSEVIGVMPEGYSASRPVRRSGSRTSRIRCAVTARRCDRRRRSSVGSRTAPTSTSCSRRSRRSPRAIKSEVAQQAFGTGTSRSSLPLPSFIGDEAKP